jgi:hypothetical protein
MKKNRQIFLKLRELKYSYLVKHYKKLLKRNPENCRYNYPYIIKRDKIITKVNLCLLHQPKSNLPKERFIWPPPNPENAKIQPHILDICQETHHCIHCNAFVFRYTKKEIKDLFEEKLKDPNYKKREYPEIHLLEWVLEKSSTDIPLIGFLWKFFYHITTHKFKKQDLKEKLT